jgi:hypothetical protein
MPFQWIPAVLSTHADTDCARSHSGSRSSVCMLAASFFIISTICASAQSHWESLGADGKLIHSSLATGDHIADFSSAGYRGGGVALPSFPTVRSVAASGHDDTAAIQRAIDEVSSLPLKGGVRGAVTLSRGKFNCSGTLEIRSSGVVLRGIMPSRQTDQGTTIVMTGSPHLSISISGDLVQKTVGRETFITDPYVPSGTTTFHVNDSSGMSAGDIVLISKPITPEWVHFMGMDDLGMRSGKREKWISGTLDVRRRIASVSGNTIILEVPLLDSYDAKYIGKNAVTVTKVVVSGQVAETGIENLRIIAPERHISFGEPEFDGVKLQDAVDSWVRSVEFLETTSSVRIDRGTERITVTDVNVVNHTTIVGSAKPSDFESHGTQILFDRCSATGDSTFYFVTQDKQQGPVVLLDCHFEGDGSVQPHQRWSTGLLVDNCVVPEGSIEFINRGMMGTGHGWTTAWSVIWNSTAKSIGVNRPPGTANWSIGNRGEETNPLRPAFEGASALPLVPGILESVGSPVKPRSLYLQQLLERLGPGALTAIGH